MVMAISAVIRSRKVRWSRASVMSDILMADDARKFSPAFNFFEIPWAKYPDDFPALVVQLFGEDLDLFFLLLHIILMALDAISIQYLGHIGKVVCRVSELAA